MAVAPAAINHRSRAHGPRLEGKDEDARPRPDATGSSRAVMNREYAHVITSTGSTASWSCPSGITGSGNHKSHCVTCPRPASGRGPACRPGPHPGTPGVADGERRRGVRERTPHRAGPRAARRRARCVPAVALRRREPSASARVSTPTTDPVPCSRSSHGPCAIFGTTTTAIFGTTKIARVDENVAAVDLVLDLDDLRRLVDGFATTSVVGACGGESRLANIHLGAKADTSSTGTYVRALSRPCQQRPPYVPAAGHRRERSRGRVAGLISRGRGMKYRSPAHRQHQPSGRHAPTSTPLADLELQPNPRSGPIREACSPTSVTAVNPPALPEVTGSQWRRMGDSNSLHRGYFEVPADARMRCSEVISRVRDRAY